MNQKSLDKKKPNNLPSDVRNKAVKPNKTKELDNHHIKGIIRWVISASMDNQGGLDRWQQEELYIQINQLLIQQRTEILEEIKKMELKHSINPNSPSRERKIIYNQAIRDVINLINKKDEQI